MNKQTMFTSRDGHRRTARKNAAKLSGILIGFELVLIMLFWLLLVVVTSADFYDSDAFIPWKPLLWIVMAVSFLALSVLGCYTISYRFLLRPLEYLDDVADAAQMLAAPTDAPVSLPADLKNMEDDLNIVRIKTLESQKAAREAEQRKNDLLIYLAHDLKTPLTSVLGYLKLLEDEPNILAELISKYTGIARAKAERLEELINQFFEITRFSTKNLVLEPAKTNLSRMLTQITYEFNPVLKERSLNWEINIPENIEIVCDADKLERAIDNVIRNAANYSFPDTAIQFTLVSLACYLLSRTFSSCLQNVHKFLSKMAENLLQFPIRLHCYSFSIA